MFRFLLCRDTEFLAIIMILEKDYQGQRRVQYVESRPSFEHARWF
jgi:hypothetical protein